MADDFMILFHDSGYRCLKHFYLIVNMLGAIAAYCPSIRVCNSDVSSISIYNALMSSFVNLMGYNCMAL